MPTRPPQHHPPGYHPQAYNKRQADKDRPSARDRGYGTDWEKLRAQLMPPGTLCARGDGKRASHLDHITARARGGTDDPSNLEPLCWSHHSQKTAAEDGGFGNRTKS